MKPTIPYIQQKFAEFNQLIFDGKLPPLPIELSNAKTFLGMLVYKKRRKLFGKVEKYDFRLRISVRHDLPEQEVEDTIIHEMIHYYIDYNQLQDTSAHGRIFRQMMTTINQRFGRHISISHHSTPEQREQMQDTTRRWHVVALVRFVDGRVGIKVIPRILPRIQNYYRAVMSNHQVMSIQFFMTNNPFFNRYPNSGSFSVHFLDETTALENLKDAKTVDLQGNISK